MDMTEIVKQNLGYVLLIGFGLGLILGLVPLFIAIKKGKLKLGLIAIICTIVAGLVAVVSIGIILPLVVSALFVWLILRKGKAPRPDPSPSDTGSE
ncbi:MAG: hypothetical protein ABI999_01525 [Acidobacteriota bacterium]